MIKIDLPRSVKALAMASMVALLTLAPTGLTSAIGTATTYMPASHMQPIALTGTYAALGDSVAAGAGLPAASGTDPACGVSPEAYPTLVAKALQQSYQSYACGGATAGDLLTQQHVANTSRDIAPQLTAAFAHGTPSLITITAGANDVHWQDFIRKCYVATCGTGADRLAASALLSAVRLKLAYGLYSIQVRSDNQPPAVIVTGYYNPFSWECTAQQTQLTAAELSWLTRQTEALNQVIASTVNAYAAFARYAPVDFTGHDLCSKDPWIQGLKDAAPLHPTAQGQQAFAAAVLQQVKPDSL